MNGEDKGNGKVTLAVLRADLTTLSRSVGEIKESMSEFMGSVIAMFEEFTEKAVSLDNKITRIEGKSESAEVRLDRHRDKINSQRDAFIEHEKFSIALSGTVEVLKSGMDKLTEKVSSIDACVQTMSKTVNKLSLAYGIAAGIGSIILLSVMGLLWSLLTGAATITFP